ncbi:glycoside hydrolase family 95 protein [Dactylosporangium vinaceum]|uniref:Glycoside hydrolase N-terminal domain-containing protein n=1 Tax=Dactylosporangium vinaceum TaxID=53362 RepID=A0ABV5MKD5_9ACTN|nr:glycoside hydrolase family 95 protein [Dactylosporangium vinaceum]UAB94115.1 glycoside hydrolase family 95 protein [Dactylosporangium vinaceum]
MARYRIELTAPAAEFEDGFPIGNGRLGAMLHGRPGIELIDLNADTFWSGGPLPPPSAPGPADLLPALRRAVATGEHARAEALAVRLQGTAWTQSYQPLGQLEWRHGDQRAITGYRRHLDLAEAEAVTQYSAASGAIRLAAYASAADGVLVVTATGAGTVPAAVAPRLHSPHPGVTAARIVDPVAGPCVVWTGRAPAHVVPNYVADRHPAVVYATDTPAADGTVEAGMGFAVATAVRRTAEGLLLVVAVETGFRGHEHRPVADSASLTAAAVARLAAALARAPQALRARHVEDYRRLFDRADLHLSGPAAAAHAELLFHLGRYLLISSSRPGTQPANLQGIWNADVRPGWSSNWTLNINTEMNYWAAESTGLEQLHEPLFQLTRDLAVAGERTAARHYAARGSAVHHNSDLWRFTAPVPGDPQWSNWPSALPWLAAHVWDHLVYGAGAGFGRATALPVLRAAARFALDLLVPDGEGALVLSPSTSPEHHFRFGADGFAATSWGCALDQELAREVLARFVALSARWPVPADAALAREAATALRGLRQVPIGADGALLEWYDERPPREPGHRHLSHLYGLFPGTRITETGTPADFAAARRALAIRLEHGSGHTGWSRAWILGLAARLRDAALAAETIGALVRDLCSTSLLTLHPDTGRPSGQIFQIDGNLGVVAGLTELLVQSHDGAIALLRALPAEWTAGAVRGIRCRGGHTAAVTWRDGRLESATVVAGAIGPLTVELAGPAVVHTVDGTPVTTIEVAGAPPGRHRLCWAARNGTEYRIG